MLLLFLHFFRPALIPNSVGEWLCDYNFIILKGGGRLLRVRSLLLLPDLWSVNIVLTFIHGNDKSKLNRQPSPVRKQNSEEHGNVIWIQQVKHREGYRGGRLVTTD